MKCTIDSVSCVYHACMGDGCQRSEVLQHHPGFGAGMCKKTNVASTSFPPSTRGSVLDSAVAVVVLTSIRNQETSIQP